MRNVDVAIAIVLNPAVTTLKLVSTKQLSNNDKILHICL